MAHPDSFGARSTLSVGGRELEIFRLAALQARYDVARLPYTLRVLLENVLRREDGVTVTAHGRRGGRRLERRRRAVAGDQLQPRPRPPAGLHRRAGRRRPGRDARRDGRPRRRPAEDQPADPGRARDRPLGPGRRLRDAVLDRAELGARVQPQPRALRVPPLGPGRLRELQGRAAEHRHLPPGEPRVPRPRGRGARRPGLSGHGRRHRLAHDDGQRPRRARLGRRRDRGRGRDARRGDLDARAAGRRLPAPRRAARGRDRDRPRAHGHPDPAPDRRRREVRRVLRPRPRRPAARRPGHDREHVARVRRDVRVLPRRRRDAPLPPAHRAAARTRSRSSRPTARRTGSGTTPRSSRRTRRSSSSTSPPSSRRSPGHGARRTGSRCAMRATPSRRRCRRSGSQRATARSTRRTRSRWTRATRRR